MLAVGVSGAESHANKPWIYIESLRTLANDK